MNFISLNSSEELNVLDTHKDSICVTILHNSGIFVGFFFFFCGGLAFSLLKGAYIALGPVCFISKGIEVPTDDLTALT